MTLETARYLSNSRKLATVFNPDLGWREVSQGLGWIVLGYFVLIASGLVGWEVYLLADQAPWLAETVRFRGDPRELFLPLSVLAFGLPALLGAILVLRGQWHCLKHAPTLQSSKELMYVCFNCVAGAAVLGGWGLALSGSRTMAALAGRTEWAEVLTFANLGGLMQLTAAVLALLACIGFTQFLGGVAGSIPDRARAASAERNLLFIGLLVGATGGTLLGGRRLGIVDAVVPWLVAGWVLWFVWHVWLACSVRGCVVAQLRHHSGVRKSVARKDAGTTNTGTLSGYRRLANRPAK